jgi:uncharacterized protein YndB with AHSA1/START domain
MSLAFSGLMAPLIITSGTDLQPELDGFAAALKRRAEQPDAAPPADQSPDAASDAASGAPSITIVRSFAAPVGEVFAAWTDPALLQRWLAPAPCQVLEATADPRPGGSYRIVVVDPGGGRHVTHGDYREVRPGKRLVKTWVYEGQNAPQPYPTLLTVDFRETGPRSTEITLRQDQLLTLQDRAGNLEGWRLCFEKLDTLLLRA